MLTIDLMFCFCSRVGSVTGVEHGGTPGKSDMAGQPGRAPRRHLPDHGKRTDLTYTELSAMPIIGPSGSTKTTSMVAVAEKLKKKHPGKTPILVVKLRSSTTKLKHLHVQILEAFNDPQADTVRNQIVSHSDNVSADAIRNVARAAGTYVVVLDESHSVIGVREKWARAQAFAPHIKSLVNDGLFAVIVMGTEDANLLFETLPELNNRKFDSISLNPIDLSNPEDFSYFYKLIGRIDHKLVALDILDEPIGLVDDLKSRGLLYDMSDGVVGVICRILIIALRMVQRKGRRTIDFDNDIKQAFWAWKAEQKDEDGNSIKIYDPFVEKIRPTTTDTIAAMSKKIGISS
ncbi:TniB family NTP-binding protein [Bradyrhizobium sp. dw_78]|uniref:TniB family NTP-binding protein n=1 Tax=Bradyrhizobium sp. dw_78 TaxID=2719793 RepID=UPI001BD68B27|nr:TniB family NTP-binding protein [Bradyrhizobium sp. dw_78]